MVYQRSFFTFLLTNALAFALVFSFVSGCKKNDDPGTSTSASLQGTWKITSISVSPAFTYQGFSVSELVSALSLAEPNCVNNVTVTFNANGTISNNVATVSTCNNATLSKQLVNAFFSSATTYTETATQVTLTSNGQNTVATKSQTATTATLNTTLPVKPDNTPGQTAYTMVLTKQ